MRATEIWQQVLAEYEPPTTDPAVVEELEGFAAHRREAIKSGDPPLEPVGL